MNCKVSKSMLHGKIICPYNKTYTHRAIFLASLSTGKSIIKHALKSNDIAATLNACKNFGAKIYENNESITVENNNCSVINTFIDAQNSGTTIRIATAISSLFDKEIILSGDDSLKQRPMQPLLDALSYLGAKHSSVNGKPPIKIRGKIKGGEITICGTLSSQFISAIMMIAPCTDIGITINITGNVVSKHYIDATIVSMNKFGVTVNIIQPYKKYFISHQKYIPTTFNVPSDFSNLALLLSASVLIGNNMYIEIENTDLPQGDILMIDILKSMGVDIVFDNNLIHVRSNNNNLTGGKFDLSNNPDLLPPLSILSLKSSKPIEIFNVKHARYKETDRLSIISRELKKLGLNITEYDDGIILNKITDLHTASLNAKKDHRLFMAFCIAGMYIGDCVITDPDSINVSYPTFITDLNNIGGKIIKYDM